MLGVAWRGLAFPVLWRLLPRTGVSSTSERIALVKRFLRLVEAGRIRTVVADREFIGEQWLAFLEEAGLPFVMRIRKNALVGAHGRAKPACARFASLRTGHTKCFAASASCIAAGSSWSGCASITAAEGLGSRPAFTRAARRSHVHKRRSRPLAFHRRR